MVKSSHLPVVAALAVATVLAGLPQELQAQGRGGGRGGGGGSAGPRGGAPPPSSGSARAVPRPPGRPPNPGGGGGGYYGRPYYGRPYYGTPYYYGGYGGPWYGGVSIGVGIGYGGFGWYGYGYPGYYGYPSHYGYPGYYGYAGYGYPAYGYPGYTSGYPPYGGVRLQLPQRRAEVWADGYFVGHVDDFDGSFQQLNLEPGAHRIEIRDQSFETIAFDVKIDPGRTIHYRSDMKPVP